MLKLNDFVTYLFILLPTLHFKVCSTNKDYIIIIVIMLLITTPRPPAL